VDPKGGQHPVRDAELRLPISKDPSKNNRTLTISVFSEEKKEVELLGEGTVDTLKSGEFDGASHFLTSQVAAGSIYECVRVSVAEAIVNGAGHLFSSPHIPSRKFPL
jgi:hypothetical protein